MLMTTPNTTPEIDAAAAAAIDACEHVANVLEGIVIKNS